jgi:hypothetical protein
MCCLDTSMSCCPSTGWRGLTAKILVFQELFSAMQAHKDGAVCADVFGIWSVISRHAHETHDTVENGHFVDTAWWCDQARQEGHGLL